MTTARRVFLYLMSLAGLILLAAGVRLLLDVLFRLASNNGGLTSGVPDWWLQDVSLGLAMLVIGGILWFPFWRSIQKRVASDPAETGKAFRKLYLNAVQLVAASNAIAAGMESLNFGLNRPVGWQLPSGQLATFVVAFAIWFYHRRVSEKEGHPTPVARTLRRWYIYILSAWGLVVLSFALVNLLGQLIAQLPFGESRVIYGSVWDSIYEYVSAIVFGGLAWGFFWFYMSRNDAGSTLRQVYFYLFAIPGSVTAALIALAVTLYRTFNYAFGAGGEAYFRFISWTAPAILVAAAVWYYHSNLAGEEASESKEKHESAGRIYLYLMSFISLGAMLSGLAAMLGVLLELIFSGLGGDTLSGTPGWWRDQLSVGLSLLIIGVPMWIFYWRRVLEMVTGNMEESRTRSRRVFLYVVLGLSIVGLAGGLVSLIYLLLNGILQHSSFNLSGIRWSIVAVLVAAPVLVYFWQALRHDQKAGSESAVSRKFVTLISTGDTGYIAEYLARSPEIKLSLLRYAGPGLETSAIDEKRLEDVRGQIEASPASRVLLVVFKSDILFLPYQD